MCTAALALPLGQSSSGADVPSCSLDMIHKEVDYNTTFDGRYGSRFENVILTLCSDQGKQIPWRATNLMEASMLDRAAEECCSDIIYGLDTVSLEDVDSVGAYLP